MGFGTKVVKGWWVIQIISVIIFELPEIVDTKSLCYWSVLKWIRIGRMSILFLPIKF